jgi:hypothetical protein
VNKTGTGGAARDVCSKTNFRPMSSRSLRPLVECDRSDVKKAGGLPPWTRADLKSQVSDPKLSVFFGWRFALGGRPKKVLAGTPRLKRGLNFGRIRQEASKKARGVPCLTRTVRQSHGRTSFQVRLPDVEHAHPRRSVVEPLQLRDPPQQILRRLACAPRHKVPVNSQTVRTAKQIRAL